jgi:hypothetical protein
MQTISLVFCQGKCFHLSFVIGYEDVFNKLFGGFQCKSMIETIGQMEIN